MKHRIGPKILQFEISNSHFGINKTLIWSSRYKTFAKPFSAKTELTNDFGLGTIVFMLEQLYRVQS